MPAKSPQKTASLKKQPNQQGFALLTVLLVVALVTMVTSELLYDQQVQIKRSSFMVHQAHSLSVAYGFEGWVKTGLKADAEDNQVDHLKELWAQPLLPIDFEGGLVSGRLLDLQARLNLNNVLETEEAKRDFWRKAIERYLETELASTTQVRDLIGFADVLEDWVDANDEPRDYGAESSVYLLRQPAYRAANQPLVMVSELQNLQQMESLTEEELFNLNQQLSALPEVTAININTASEKTLVALADWLTEPIAKQWLVARNTEPAEELADFINFMIDATGFEQVEIEKSFPKGVIDVQSHYFLLQAQVDYGEVKQLVSSIFKRDNEAKVTLVQRWLSVG